jgi:hypothetical protein
MRVKTLIIFLLRRIISFLHLGFFYAFLLFTWLTQMVLIWTLALRWRHEVGVALVEVRTRATQLRPPQDHHRPLRLSVVPAVHLVARPSPR